MQVDLLNIGLGFIEGFALILSPCILPILPIFLAGSLTGSKRRPIGIIIGFILVFSLFTFFSRTLLTYLGIDSNIIRQLSYFILILFGIIMLSTRLTEKFALLTSRLTNTGSSLAVANNPEGGMLSGFLFGSLIALIWTPCAGPILAAVIVQIVIQKTNLLSFLTILAFGLGAAIPMLAIALFGRELMNKLSFLKQHSSFIRKCLGAIIILSVVYMIYSDGIINTSISAPANNTKITRLQNGIIDPYPAPEISGISAWINSQPITIQELKGKVILIDFWTYSCINCIRTLPYIKDWYHKYHDKGLVVIGIHTPEFDFEKDLSNVKSAVAKDGILYPVALDSNFVTWQNYSNQYWPAHYLIDKNGYVVYTHFGEGDYDVTENNIRYLLGLNESSVKNADVDLQASTSQTPETYFGYARAERFASPEGQAKDSPSLYSFPKNLTLNNWALQGKWTVLADRIVSDQANASLEMNFYAKNVYIVMGSANGSAVGVKILLNGKIIDSQNVKVDRHTIYPVIQLDHAGNNTLTVISAAPGLEVFTFTFGG